MLAGPPVTLVHSSSSSTHLYRIRIMHDCALSTLTHKNVADPCIRALLHETMSSTGCRRRLKAKRLCRARLTQTRKASLHAYACISRY